VATQIRRKKAQKAHINCAAASFASKSDIMLGHSQYRERFYERAVKKKVFFMPPTVLGS
jgi:hypothetical protein